MTLKDIDGGQNYFEQWSNTFPSAAKDPSFYPITLFNAHDLGNASNGQVRAPTYKSMGINTFVGLYNGALGDNPPSLDVVKQNGMYAIVSAEKELLNSSFSNKYSGSATGYVYQDELEGNGCSSGTLHVEWLRPFCTESNGKVKTSSLITMSNQVRALDNTRPIYQGFTGSYLAGYINGSYDDIVTAGDIIGYDKYPMVDRRDNSGGSIEYGKPWASYQLVMRAREHIGGRRPVWPDIETSQVDTFNTICYRPSGADVQSLVWNAIIAGARGITYFNNNFATNCPGSTGADVLLKTDYADIKTAVTTVNGRVKNLAPVINAYFANGYDTHIGQVNSMTKYYGGRFYIFAAPKASGSQSATFTLAGAPTGTVTVVDENRTIPIVNGKFTDTFANETTTHIYKVN